MSTQVVDAQPDSKSADDVSAIAAPSYSLRPAFERSILQPLFSTPAESLDCANQLHLHLLKDDLLKNRFIYNVAHSPWYRRWFLLVTLFFTCTCILWQAPWMQRVEVTCIILLVCSINLPCSLTRVDRNLFRALSETFEWPYLIVVLYTFIAFNALTQQQDDTYGKVREAQWSMAQIHGFVQSIALCAPICFLLSNLDAIPLYPVVVKSGILLCGLMILLRVLVLDLRNYMLNGETTSESTEFGEQHMLCIGTWLCSTVKSIGNLFAGQVTFFLVRHAYITITALRGEGWKRMTILNVPLLIHPNFERDAYEEEQGVVSPSTQPEPIARMESVPQSNINTIHVMAAPALVETPPHHTRTYTRLDRRASLLSGAKQGFSVDGGSAIASIADDSISKRQSVRIVATKAASPLAQTRHVSLRRLSMTLPQPIMEPATAALDSVDELTAPSLNPASVVALQTAVVRQSVDGLTTSTHRIDHRVKSQARKQVVGASEYAFEVGGYADVLHEKSLQPRDVVPWMFPVEFRPLNPMRFVRRWVWHHKHWLETWFFAGYVINVLIFGTLILVAAYVPSASNHVAVITIASASATASFCAMIVLGTTVSDRRILWYLVKTFESILTLYQVAYVLITSVLLPSEWYHWMAAWLWMALNVQIIFFDAAIWYSPLHKRSLIGLGIYLSFVLFAIDVASHSSMGLADHTSCFITCTSLHASNVFSLMLATIFQLKYMFKIFKRPSGAIILSVPVLYVGKQPGIPPAQALPLPA